MSEPHKVSNRKIKKMKRQIRDDLYTTIIVLQRRPYTVAIARAVVGTVWYTDIGFSKCNWPDWFISTRGATIATGRAIENIAMRVLGVQCGQASIEEPAAEALALFSRSDIEDELNPLLIGA